jgi:hypothetical protein
MRPRATSSHPRRTRLAPTLLGFALVLVLAGSGWASCGLDGCAVVQPGQTETLRVITQWRYTAFDRDGVEGHYTQTVPRLEFVGLPGAAFGAWLPVVTLEQGDLGTSGLGNGVLFAQFDLLDSGASAISAGFQVELPTADSDAGLGDDHVELLPYAMYSLAMGRWTTHIHLGWREAVGDTDSDSEILPEEDLHSALRHGPDPEGRPESIVNPHTGREFVWRWSLESQWWNRIEPALHLDTQREIRDERRSYVSGIVSARARVGRGWFVTGLAQWPISSDRRLDSSTALAISTSY